MLHFLLRLKYSRKPENQKNTKKQKYFKTQNESGVGPSASSECKCHLLWVFVYVCLYVHMNEDHETLQAFVSQPAAPASFPDVGNNMFLVLCVYVYMHV